jgi:hypothetical protein
MTRLPSLVFILKVGVVKKKENENEKNKKKKKGWGCNLVVKDLPDIYKAPCSIPNIV